MVIDEAIQLFDEPSRCGSRLARLTLRSTEFATIRQHHVFQSSRSRLQEALRNRIIIGDRKAIYEWTFINLRELYSVDDVPWFARVS